MRPVDHLIESSAAAGQARENNVCPLAECRWRRRCRAADLFEFGQRAAPIAENLIAGREQLSGDLDSDPSRGERAPEQVARTAENRLL